MIVLHWEMDWKGGARDLFIFSEKWPVSFLIRFAYSIIWKYKLNSRYQDSNFMRIEILVKFYFCPADLGHPKIMLCESQLISTLIYLIGQCYSGTNPTQVSCYQDSDFGISPFLHIFVQSSWYMFHTNCKVCFLFYFWLHFDSPR